MQCLDLNALCAEQLQTGRRWWEFLRVPSLSMGLYHLKVGQADPQQPHAEDEVYYVVSGRATFEAGQERQSVEPGTLIFVEGCAEHRFIDIAEDLTVLVFFAPAEGTCK
jgi:mannose-6-phosphate isomerase-like protein (cupin superfamily)